VPPAPVRPDPLVIRPLASPADYDACVALQQATWGDDFRELVPPAMLQISQKVGGIATGAFMGGRLMGFVFGITGFQAGHPVHWSHMLAVDASCRDRGVGRALKEYQRAEVVALGVERMFWTYDPLVARNAHLNVNRLKARVTAYVRDMYGDNPMSRTDSVIGTDRLVVEWDLRPLPRTTPPGGRGGQGGQGGQGRMAPVAFVMPGDATPLPKGDTVLIPVPDDIQSLKGVDPDAARAWRASTRRAFEHYLRRGYVVTRLVRDVAPGTAHYVVTRP
jgi:chorismate synthase